MSRSIDASTSFSAALLVDALQRQLGDELLAAPFQHLGNAIQDLAAKIGAGLRPARLRLARGDDGVAKILATAAANVCDDPRLSCRAAQSSGRTRFAGNLPSM